MLLFIHAHNCVAPLCYFIGRQLILHALTSNLFMEARVYILHNEEDIITATLLQREYINSKQTLSAWLWNQMLNQYVFPVLCSSFIVLWANEPKNETSPLRHTHWLMYIKSLHAKRVYVDCSRKKILMPHNLRKVLDRKST
jgi:hypothetical protein